MITRAIARRSGVAGTLALAVVTLGGLAPGHGAGEVPPPRAATPAGAYCAGEYADDFSALSAAARAFDAQQAPYTFCIRTSAMYECPYYGPDGTLRRTRKRVVAHGTGFGYRRDGGDTLVVTNEHVAEWPAATDEAHTVEGVPAGCKRVSDGLKIVDNEADAYERDDIALARVVVDSQMDVAVLRAKTALPVMPWKVGRSAALRERNAVDVRGFPLGVLRTTNVGKVTSAYEHDDDRDWDHDDFVIDALLSPGNSGSPVFAVSCRTGEFELVGIYHAGFTRGSALNVVVGIDQLRGLLENQKRTPRPRPDAVAALDPAARARALEWARSGAEGFLPLGQSVVAVAARPDGALVLQVMGRDFPVRAQPVLVLEDLPPEDGGFGRIGRVWSGDGAGLRLVDRSALEADAQAQLARLVDVLRRGMLAAASYGSAARLGAATRERFDALARLERAVRKLADGQEEVGQNALDLADRITPDGAELPLAVADALAVPPVVAAAPIPAAAPPPPAPLPALRVVPPGR